LSLEQLDVLLNQEGFALYLLVFIGGLGLNLTPCIYPLIPVTLSYFSGRQTDGSPSKSRTTRFFNALLYVLGIAITYSALGTAAATSGALFGSFLQSPWVRIVFALIFFTMALGEFGLFHFPSMFTKIPLKGGIGMPLIMGATMGFVAAPCIGPVVVALLTFVAEKQDPWIGFRLFFTLSMGLGLPYLFLAYFAEGIKKLPKSGNWLNWVHKLFGVGLLGLALFYVYPLAKPYLSSDPEKPSQIESKNVLVKKGEFAPFSLKSLEAYKGKAPIMVDMVADWCAPCKELELKTFPDEKVKPLMDQMILFKLDLTDEPPEKIAKWMESKKILGVPTILFFDSSGKIRDDIRLTAFEGPEGFSKRLKSLLGGN
jgi:thiol:disulfide interchange protein DsbD